MEQETHLLSSVNLLTNTIASDYRLTPEKLKRLASHGEITFDLLLIFDTCSWRVDGSYPCGDWAEIVRAHAVDEGFD
jgi:hypothetical protein